MRERSMETSNTFANFTWLKAGQYAVVGLAIALGLSYIGPYGTYGYDPVWCAFFWVSVVMLGWVEGIFLTTLLVVLPIELDFLDGRLSS